MIKLWRFFKGLKAEEKSSEIWLLSEIAWIYNNKKSDFLKGVTDTIGCKILIKEFARK